MLTFSTKAMNLKNLTGILQQAKILPLCITNLRELDSNFEVVYERILNLEAKKLIIRSSSICEDSTKESNAGAFLSIPNISLDRIDKLKEALYEVGHSMPSVDDEILIQPMLENIAMCGVAFSIDKDNGAPYFCISYDCSGSNEAVTSGNSSNIQTFYYYRDSKESSLAPNPPLLLQRVISMMRELEIIFDCRALDVEFAFVANAKDLHSSTSMQPSLQNFKDTYCTHAQKYSLDSMSNIESSMSDFKLYCLQVRSLVMDNKPNLFDNIKLRALERLSKRIDAMSDKHPHIFGDRAMFGVMPDWNPAEIIGLKPKRLALSLYKELVTDCIWAYQRDNYGYRNLRSYPLMHSFLGIPYIDVRVSFNSFIPKNLDSIIANKLANYYLDSLAKKPQLHDKVEFDIVLSCYDLNISSKLNKLLCHGFNENEIKRIEFCLLDLTNNIIVPNNGYYVKDLSRVKELNSRYERIINSNLPLYDKIYWLIEDCKRFGTLPFAGVARAAFVAMQILNSLVEINFLSHKEKQDFLASLKTISKELSYDIQHINQMGLELFLQKYGHLRAGSYNILSPRYDENFEGYFGNIKLNTTFENNNITSISTNKDLASPFESQFSLSKDRIQELDRILRENGLNINAEGLFRFFKIVIEGREAVKFEFSKLLSKVLSLIKELGDNLGISANDMSHLDIKSILSLYSSLYKDSPKERFLSEIESHKQEFELTTALKLPPLILHGKDIFGFYVTSTIPNFITNKTVMSDIVSIVESSDDDISLEGKIVCIPSADPGFDYLFTKNIAGLITCYGGANSHMAIRASELLLPSAIGVGEEMFSKICNAGRVRLECESNQIFCL
ncbi:phosphoenolpyruvate synthase [Helicobacter muridarum]|nr:phosphoenolpyruvate synthase [Helicobacter muridarum]